MEYFFWGSTSSQRRHCGALMPVLHFGVIDQPYNDPAPVKKRGRKPAKAGSTQSTGDVAEILEAKYHVMQVFYQQHKGDIAGDLSESIAGSLESMLMGAPINMTPFQAAAYKIDDRFKRFLSDKEMDR